MSSTDIFQLYACACEFRQAFGIVLSPRGEGLKALCVHLTQKGFRLVARFCQEATRMKVDVMQYALSQISASHEKLYCQVPFDISSEPCHVVYLRGKEVVQQLRDFIISGKADECWIRPASPSGIFKKKPSAFIHSIIPSRWKIEFFFKGFFLFSWVFSFQPSPLNPPPLHLSNILPFLSLFLFLQRPFSSCMRCKTWYSFLMANRNRILANLVVNWPIPS